MSEYVTYLDGGRTNGEGLYKYLNRLFVAGVPTQFAPTSMQVIQRGAGANMSVDVSVGDVMLNMPTNAYALWGYTDAVKNVTLTAANATNPRIDSIVVYVDATAFTAGTSNNPGALKFVAVAGTPSGTPVVPTTAAIQTAIGGSTIPYMVLATVAVAANTTTITTANISDARTAILPNFIVPRANISPSLSTFFWEEIGRTTLVSAAAALTVPGFTAKKYLQISIKHQQVGLTVESLRFNNDSGANYSRRSAVNQGADTTTASDTAWSMYSDNGQYREIKIDVTNGLSDVKLGTYTINVTGAGASAATPPNRVEGIGLWNNTAAQITRVDYLTSSGQFAAGSEMVILGHD